MNKKVKKIVAATMGVVMFSALTAGYVSAANLDKEYFSKTCQAGTYCSVALPKQKANDSDMYIKINTSSNGYSYRIRAMATYENGTTNGNYTLCEDIYVNYVTCSKNTSYGIQNGVYGVGESYGVLQFYQTAGYGQTTGQWAVDTNRDYSAPEAPW